MEIVTIFGANGTVCDAVFVSRCYKKKDAMRKVVTRLCFLSQDRGLYHPLILGTPSSAYSTMSHTALDATVGNPAHPAVGKGDEDTDTTNSPAVLPPIADEPIVTRKELWSYYCNCIFSLLSPRGCRWLTTCLPVYYNGDNVRRFVNLSPK